MGRGLYATDLQIRLRYLFESVFSVFEADGTVFVPQEINIKARFNCRSVCSVFEVDGAGSVCYRRSTSAATWQQRGGATGEVSDRQLLVQMGFQGNPTTVSLALISHWQCFIVCLAIYPLPQWVPPSFHTDSVSSCVWCCVPPSFHTNSVLRCVWCCVPPSFHTNSVLSCVWCCVPPSFQTDNVLWCVWCCVPPSFHTDNVLSCVWWPTHYHSESHPHFTLTVFYRVSGAVFRPHFTLTEFYFVSGAVFRPHFTLTVFYGVSGAVFRPHFTQTAFYNVSGDPPTTTVSPTLISHWQCFIVCLLIHSLPVPKWVPQCAERQQFHVAPAI